MVSLSHDEKQPMSLRERKKRLAQDTIEETALRLFQQQGYEQTSIQDIANAVEVSRRLGDNELRAVEGQGGVRLEGHAG